MARTRVQTYPHSLLDQPYIHTNFYHFEASLGSFGDPQSDFDAAFETTLAKQKQREAAIDARFREIDSNMTFDTFIENVRGLQKSIKEDTPALGAITRAGYRKKGDKEWSPGYIKEQIHDHFQPYFDAHHNVMAQAIGQGGFSLEEIEKVIPDISALYERLDTILDKYAKLGTDSKNLTDAKVKGMVNYFKGEGWEGVAASAIAQALRMIKGIETKDMKVDLTGSVSRQGGQKVKVDVLPHLDAWNISAGVSVKATREHTLRGQWGATLHSGTLQTLESLLLSTNLLGSPVEAYKLRYFMMNLIRMRDYSQAGGHPVAGPSTITDYPKYYQFTQDIAKTYATFFIGEVLPADEADENLVKLSNVDILFLGDLVYKKSEILEKIKNDEMNIKFKIAGYKKLGEKYWMDYDTEKRYAMREYSGMYREVGQQEFVRKATESLYGQPIRISLHLIA